MLSKLSIDNKKIHTIDKQNEFIMCAFYKNSPECLLYYF